MQEVNYFKQEHDINVLLSQSELPEVGTLRRVISATCDEAARRYAYQDFTIISLRRSILGFNCVCNDHRDKTKVPDPLVKDLISKTIVEQIILKRARLISRSWSGKYISPIFRTAFLLHGKKGLAVSKYWKNLLP